MSTVLTPSPSPPSPPDTAIDLLPFIEDLWIVDKAHGRSRQLGPIMHWPQRLLVDWTSQNITARRPSNAIVLKARQLGISTIIKGIEFALAAHKFNFRSRTISHETASNQHLLSMTQHFFDHYEFSNLYTQRNRSANLVSFDPLNSQLAVITAKNLGGGRSQSIQFLHGSEIASWPDPGSIMASISAALSSGWFRFVYLESTALGLGNYFHTTWDDAVNDKNDYTPFFFPWQTHPEYIGSFSGLQPLDSRSLTETELTLAAEFAKCRLGDENINVLSRTMAPADLRAIRGPMPRDEILSRLAWRRHKIRNDFAKRTDGANPEDLFLQEYPHIPSVAFLSTGLNLFHLDYLHKTYSPRHARVGHISSVGGRIKFIEDPRGPLRVFHPPVPGRSYIVAGDPTFTLSGDSACAQIIDPHTFTQMAVWRDRITPGEFGDIMVKLGYWYNTALLAPETNKAGADTIARISAGHSYPNIWLRRVNDSVGQRQVMKEGWHTNSQTKHEALSNLKSLIYDGSLRFHDSHTFSELRNYVDRGNGTFGNANGEPNDDTVMALAIAVTVANYEFASSFTPDPDNHAHLRAEINRALEAEGDPLDNLAALATRHENEYEHEAEPAW